MAKQFPAKRARRANPREDRNNDQGNVYEFKRGKNSKAPTEGEPAPAGKKVIIVPKSRNQQTFLNHLEDETKAICLGVGFAGVGKTWLSCLYAIKQLQEGKINKIIVTRPLVGSDELGTGFLPGNLTEKLMPWAAPVIEIFKEFYSPAVVNAMLFSERLELAPISMLRGRTFKNCIVIFDEAQNATCAQVKLLCTRIGENARIVITGDVSQNDRKGQVNGLEDLVSRLHRSPSENIALTEFHRGDIERHPVIETILALYGDDV